jgi:NodT family efflux transporter outer membrane factor (OMF) lipoprotein
VKVWLVFPAVALVAGCAVGPEYFRPEADAPKGWMAAGSEGSAGKVVSGRLPETDRPWWTLLGDPTLDRLMEAGERENFDLKRARARVLEARASRRATAAQLYPEVAAGAAAARGNALLIGQDQTVSLYEAAFDASWEIDLFGATRSRVEATDALARAAEESAADVLLTLRAEVARNYIEMRAAQNRLELALDTLRARHDTVALVKALRAAGLRSGLDVTQAETQTLALQAQIPTLQTAVTAAARRLDTLLGRPPGTLETELANAAPVPVARELTVLDEPAAVIARRPDLKRAERELAAATALTAAATADLYPKVSLGGLYGFRNLSGLPGSTIWSLGAGATWSLINFGGLEAEVDAADARRQQFYFAYRQAVLAALEDVEVSLTGFVNAGRNLRALDVLVENEQSKLALAEERYRRGLSPFIDVLDAQRSLYAAQTDRVGAEAEQVKGYVALNKALGG